MWMLRPSRAPRIRAGNSADSAAVALHLPPKLPRLVITEVLANPAGSEYTQEFVELENLEAEPVVAGRHAHRRQDRQRRLARCGMSQRAVSR